MKVRACIYIDKKDKDLFNSKYPMMLSRYLEKCIKDAINDKQKVIDCVEKKPKETIFNIFKR